MNSAITTFFTPILHRLKIKAVDTAAIISNIVGFTSLVVILNRNNIYLDSMMIPVGAFFINIILTLANIFGISEEIFGLNDILTQEFSQQSNRRVTFSDEIEEHVSDLDIESCGQVRGDFLRNPRFRKLLNATSKQEAIRLHSILQLRSRVSLPTVTIEDILSGHVVDFEWIFDTYSYKFLSMWWEVSIPEVIRVQKLVELKRKRLRRENLTANVETLAQFCSRIAGIIYMWLMCRATGETFRASTSFAGYNIGKDMGNLLSVFTENLTSKITGEKSAHQLLIEKLQPFIDDMNCFLEMPSHKLAQNYILLCEYRTKIEEFSKIIRDIPREKQQIFHLASGLYQAANVKKNEIFSSELPNFSRQEPFLFLLRGPGGIGKTRLAKHLAQWFCKDVLKEDNLGKNYIEITPTDKYWPPLGSQRIAFFDEAASSRDLREDLLFSNLKGICSPAYFNCAAADITHKISPCNFQFCLATTNTSTADLCSRIAAISSATSVYPYFRRMMLVDCSWANGDFDHNSPSGYNSDFSHLKLSLCDWDGIRQTVRVPNAPINLFELKEKIKNRFHKHVSDFHTQSIMQGMERQTAQSKNHYSAILHGPGGSGKTTIMEEMARRFTKATGFPIHKFSTLNDINSFPKSNKRVIALCDDLFKCTSRPELEEAFMHLYNEKLANNSIILSTTNLSPKMGMPIINFNGIVTSRTHPFINIGLTRRLGFTGNFGDSFTPFSNFEAIVTDGSWYDYKDVCFSIPWIVYLSIVLIASFFFLPIAVLSLIPLIKFFQNKPRSDNIYDCIYSQYKNFLKFRKSYEVIEATAPNFEPNFIFKARNISCISHAGSVSSLASHVFIHKNRFDASNADWKFLISRNVAAKLQVNINKFMFPVSDIVEADIIPIAERYAKMFLEMGITPKLKIEIGGIGTLSLIDNKIYTNFNMQMEQQSEFAIIGSNIVGIDVSIPIAEYFDNVDCCEVYNLSLEQAIDLKDFASSRRFYSHPTVIKILKEKAISTIKAETISFFKAGQEKVVTFFNSPIGKFTTATLTIISAMFLAYKTYNHFFVEPQRKKKGLIKKKNPNYHTDAEDEKVGKKKKRQNPKYDTDPEDRPREIKAVEEDVKTLCDMNDFSAYSQYVSTAHPMARKNLAQMYLVLANKDKLSKEPKGNQACYGLFLKKNLLVTVGHIVPDLNNNPNMNLYVGADEFEGIYKCEKVMCYQYRDLSVWRVPNLPINYKDISSLFVSQKSYNNDDDYTVALERLCPGKISQWSQGRGSYYKPIWNVSGHDLSDFGYVDWATCNIKLTTYGDCGLPYYHVEPKLNNKIFGIHTMGNSKGYDGTGILAIIYSEDIPAWDRVAFTQNLTPPEHPIVVPCEWCEKSSFNISLSITPKAEGHEIAWNKEHETSPSAFYDELRYYTGIRTNFSGIIIKNVGPNARGSVEHSHTQFIPTGTEDMPKITNGCKTTTVGDLGIKSPRLPDNMQVVRRVHDIPFPSLYTCLDNCKLSEDWRIYAYVYVENGKRKARVEIQNFFSTKMTDIEFKEFTQEAGVTVCTPSGEAVYVTEDIRDIYESAAKNQAKGLLPDVPFEQIPDNETVTVFGVLKQSASRLPRDKYYRTPFSMDVEHLIPVEKAPVRMDSENAPPEIKETMYTNRVGKPDIRITQSIQWAHKSYSPPIGFRRYVKEQFLAKILQHYSGLKLLTDKQVFEGYKQGHSLYGSFSPLELDKSIGFTMKQLYHVQVKSDVIQKTPEGEYFWRTDSEAALFAKDFYEYSKDVISKGGYHYSAFLELSKMEKLKLSKIWTGRTFAAQDLNGVLIERHVLGEFAARAMKYDKTCGVGINAYDDFHGLALHLRQYPNTIPGDYKRFDRTTPACVFDDICELLCDANPKIQNQIRSVFHSLRNRIQISGTTVFECVGGMPSGCSLTASLNSLNNDYIIYSAYVRLAHQNNAETTYAYFDKHVHRKYYGDDVILTVDDEIKDFFHLVNISKVVLELFGMTLDTADKDGRIREFVDWDEASWISRYFRLLDVRYFYVGALKKISIGSNFHYVTSLRPEHLGSLFETAQFEAALWDTAYFERIQEAIRVAIKRMPAISKHFSFRSKIAIQRELYESAILKYGGFQSTSGEPDKLTLPPLQEIKSAGSVIEEVNDKPTFFERYNFSKSYHKNIILFPELFVPNRRRIWREGKRYDIGMSYASKLNEDFQKGTISKPNYIFTANRLATQWSCELIFDLGKDTIKTYGDGRSQKEAREEAAFQAYIRIHPTFVGPNIKQLIAKQT